MIMKNTRLITILSIVALLLLPLIAMQYTTEVNWSGFDFVVAATLLLGTGLTLELILRKVTEKRHRISLSMALLVLFLLIWAELAVGLFGTPLAGS